MPCVALVGVGFLLRVGRECHSENRTKFHVSEITKKLGMAREKSSIYNKENKECTSKSLSWIHMPVRLG